MKYTKLITTALILVFAFFMLMSFSMKGAGHAGHGGYHRGPSFFYWGGGHYYGGVGGKTVRDGSTRGPNYRGGGYQGGK